MKYKLLIYDNPDTREAFFGEEGEGLMGEMDALMRELTESKEQLGGYLIIDCESPERATEIATRWPNARLCAMEVRPIMQEAGTEM